MVGMDGGYLDSLALFTYTRPCYKGYVNKVVSFARDLLDKFLFLKHILIVKQLGLSAVLDVGYINQAIIKASCPSYGGTTFFTYPL
jgi:hypothetical protein